MQIIDAVFSAIWGTLDFLELSDGADILLRAMALDYLKLQKRVRGDRLSFAIPSF